MLMDGDALGKHLMQLAAACRKCGAVIEFQEGAALAIDKGIHDQVVMCKDCQAVYTVNITPRALTLVTDVTQKYFPEARVKQTAPEPIAEQYKESRVSACPTCAGRGRIEHRRERKGIFAKLLGPERVSEKCSRCNGSGAAASSN